MKKSMSKSPKRGFLPFLLRAFQAILPQIERWFVRPAPPSVPDENSPPITETKPSNENPAEKSFAEKNVVEKNSTEEYLRSLLDSSSMYVIRTDTEGKYTYANRAFLETFVQPKDRPALIGTPAMQYIIPEDHEKTSLAVQTCFFHPDKPVQITLRKPSASGKTLLTDWEFRSITRQGGTISEIQCTGFDVTRQRATERELLQSKQLLDETGSIARIGGWEYFVADDTVRLTKEIYRILGLPENKPVSVKEGISFYHPDDQPRLSQSFQNLLQTGMEFDHELRLITSAGKQLWVRGIGKSEKDASGNIVRLYGTLQDITAQKQIEFQLLQSKQLLDETGSIARIGGWEYFVETNTLRWTQETYLLYEVPFDADLSILQGVSFYHPDDQALISAAVENLLKNGQEYDHELRFVTARKNTLWVRTIGKCEKNAEGKVVRIYGTFQDITARVKSQQHLIEREAFISKILHASPIIVYVFDLKTSSTVFISDSVEKLLGYSLLEYRALNEHFHETLMHPDDVEQDLEHRKQLLFLKDGEIAESEYRILHKNGTWKWFSIRATPFLRSSDGRLEQIIGVMVDITHTKWLEEDLQKTNNRLRALIAAIPVPVNIVRLSDGKILYTNALFRQMFSLPDDIAHFPSTINLYVNPADRETLINEFKKNNIILNKEVEFQSLDSRKFWAVISAFPVSFDQENAVLVTFLDITERKAMLHQLAEYSRELESIIDAMIDGLVLFDADERIVMVNPSLCTMFGYTQKDLLGKSLEMLMPERFRAHHRRFTAEFLSLAPYRQRVSTAIGLRSNGAEFPMETSFASFRYDGKIMLLAILRDVTDQRLREENLRQSEANLRAIMDSSVQAFWLIDTDLRVVAYNKLVEISVQRLFGRAIERGDSIFEFVALEEQDIFRISVNRALQGEPVFYERKVMSEEGEEQWHEMMYLPTYQADGRISGVTLSALNITDRKLALQELTALNQDLERRVFDRTKKLTEANAEKDELMSIAAHDLKNPLSSILSSAEILQRYYADNKDVERFVRSIILASEQMLEIITKLLDVNRLETGQFHLALKPVLFKNVCEAIMQEYTRRAELKDITIHSHISEGDGPLMIRADELALRQVLENLISNAIKYAPPRTNVWVRARRILYADGSTAEYHIRLEVQDEGPGLSEEDKQKLFQKFTRLSAKPTGGEQSTGLGLSIVKKLVEMQHGRVWCESTQGKGAMFIVELPAAEVGDNV